MSDERPWPPPSKPLPAPTAESIPPAAPLDRASATFDPFAATVAALGGALSAVAITVAAATADGVPADDYSAPNRAAFGFMLIGLLMLLPLASFVVFTVASALGTRLVVSAAVSQTPALIAIALILKNW